MYVCLQIYNQATILCSNLPLRDAHEFMKEKFAEKFVGGYSESDGSRKSQMQQFHDSWCRFAYLYDEVLLPYNNLNCERLTAFH